MRIARVVSVVFHPLLLTTYLTLILGGWVPSLLRVRQEHLLAFLGSIFAITFVFPTLSLLMFRQMGVIGSLKMESRRERIFPFLFNALLYVLVAALFVYKGSASFANMMMIVAALAISAATFTFFFKVSVHSISWGGLVGILMAINGFVGGALLVQTMLLIVLAGVVMSARLKLNAHSLTEVMTGGVTGFVIGFIGMRILF